MRAFGQKEKHFWQKGGKSIIDSANAQIVDGSRLDLKRVLQSSVIHIPYYLKVGSRRFRNQFHGVILGKGNELLSGYLGCTEKQTCVILILSMKLWSKSN